MKKLIIIVLTLLLCSAFSLNAFADVWIPPTDDGGYCEALAELASNPEEAEVLNRFASEYLQAGLESFSDSTSDEEVAAAVVRMICQHPERYEGISYACGRCVYIGIPSEIFAACAKEKFGRTLRADDYFDFENGIFHVKQTAELWQASNRFAVAEVGYYNGDSNYHFSFKVYETTADPETCYALEDPTTAENAEFIGYSIINLYYGGDLAAKHFETSDFTLTYLGTLSNFPIAAETAETQETQETQYQTPEETEAGSVSKTAEVTEANTEKPSSGGLGTTGTIVFTAAVAAAVAAAAVAIVLIWKKKR